MDFLKQKTKRKNSKNSNKQSENQEEKNNENEEQKNSVTSFEGFQKYKVLESADVSEFNLLINLEPPSPDLSLFQTKKLAEEYFHENKYNIEDLLEYDNTNPNIQKKYLSMVINKLNKDPAENIKIILIEKIKKSGIILEKKDYDEEIQKVKNEEVKKNLEYINFKKSLINCLTYIKDNETGNADKAKKKLNLGTIFTFNHQSTFGPNNYYFYKLVNELIEKLEEIYDYYHFYKYIIEKDLEYLTTNLSELTEKDLYKFKFVNYILLAPDTIKNRETFDNIKNFLEGEPITYIKELEKSINNRNIEESKKNQDYIKNKKHIEYKINFNDTLIEYIINENSKFDRKIFSKKYIKKYNFKIFNKQIIKIIKQIPLYNFESGIYQNILPDPDFTDSFYKDDKKIIYQIITKILKSKAAKKFFGNIYENKYNKVNNNKIEYHFDKDDVIEEILKRIEFYPMYNSTLNAFTSPSDLTIAVNSIPGTFDKYDEINYFNKRILQIGRIIIFIIHEIFGHFLRRYYSYLTNGIIKMNTNDDDLIDTKPEGGEFIEDQFLGIKTRSRLYLKDVLFLLFYGENFEIFPLVKENVKITEEILEKITIDNPRIFDFIIKEKKINDDEKVDNGKEKTIINSKKKETDKNDIIIDKITIEQYCNYINPVRRGISSIISCGFRKNEAYIEL